MRRSMRSSRPYGYSGRGYGQDGDGDDGEVDGGKLRKLFGLLPAPSYGTTTILLAAGGILLSVSLFDALLRRPGGDSFMSTSFLSGGRRSSKDGDSKDGEAGPSIEDDPNKGKFGGRYPNSILTLFFPYTLLRDVVLDQPVDRSDIPFFWHVHDSDERLVKKALTDCYGLDLIELNDMASIEKAKQVNLAQSLGGSTKHVVTSPFVRDAAEVFTPENFGRMFCFFRHPVDYDVPTNLPRFERNDNWLTRFLTEKHDGELGLKELGIAKHVVRETCVVGTLGTMKESLKRIAAYYGWEYVGSSGGGGGGRNKGGGGNDGGADEDDDDAIPANDANAAASSSSSEGEDKCLADALRTNPKEKFVNHESNAWKEFYALNTFDCQLYELAQSTWRAQIQTIIPFALQLQRKDPDSKKGDEE